MGTISLRQANVIRLWNKRTYAGDIAVVPHTETRSTEVGYCVNGPWRFYFIFHGSRLKYQRIAVWPCMRRGGLCSTLPYHLKFLEILSKTPSKMSTSSPEAVKKLLENMQTDLRSLSMECKKKFPPVKEVSLLLAIRNRYYLWLESATLHEVALE